MKREKKEYNKVVEKIFFCFNSSIIARKNVKKNLLTLTWLVRLIIHGLNGVARQKHMIVQAIEGIFLRWQS